MFHRSLDVECSIHQQNHVDAEKFNIPLGIYTICAALEVSGTLCVLINISLIFVYCCCRVESIESLLFLYV